MKRIHKAISLLIFVISMSLMLSFNAYADGERVHMTEENKVPLFICLGVALVASVAIVNGAYRLYMKVMDTDMMFYSRKKKLIAIGVLTFILFGLLCKLIGIY